jgi:hypothetical protein
VSIDAAQNPAYALAFHDAVETAVRESAGEQADNLLNSLRFFEALNPLVGEDVEHEDFTHDVKLTVEAYLASEGERATEAVTEVEDRIDGRVLEAAGTATDGGRIFRVEIIAAGDSKNGRRYPAQVLESAVPLYEGAKAFDHHRSPAELQSSTIHGLVGHYRNVKWKNGRCMEADLHLLPSATHTAEALDATITAQAAGLAPLVGISHDAMTVLKTVNTGGRHVQEAVRITKVHSADVVADPAAGGKATRVLAGGIETDLEQEETYVTVTSEAMLAVLNQLTPEQLAAAGFSKANNTTESTDPQRDTAAVEPTVFSKTGFMGKTMVQAKVTEANLPVAMVAQVLDALPARITESDVDAQIAVIKTTAAMLERANLAPTMTAEVVKESYDKKLEALDGFFQGNGKGYNSFRDAFIDFTGNRPRIMGEDFSRVIMRESVTAYDSGQRSGQRTTESLDSTSWAQALGDSVTRQTIAAYGLASLQSWRKIVSRTPSVNDFRQQKRFRTGGYGLLTTVNQGQPYPQLTSPGDEEATYTLTKKGGTEDLTLEMIANDDVQAIQDIPNKLGRSAAITLFRFVWDMLSGNTTATYDSVALFDSGHANTDTSSALSQTTMSVGRRKMREQAAYGNSVDLLSLVPKFLVVPPELEEIAFQISRSAVAIPSTAAGPSDTPNLHQGTEVIVLDHLTDANDWFLVADPVMCPTIEIGFYLGRQDPELFTQSDPTQGSAFSADKQTWKIRHIYNGTVLDHRAFYRGQG